MTDLTHADGSGRAEMVDVSAKPDTVRTASVVGAIRMDRGTLNVIRANQLSKGDVLSVARVAGIMAAKRTSDLIPLCHPIALTDAGVEFTFDDSLPGIRVKARAATTGKTGVEMEAFTAAAAALLTIYDMAKGIDRGMVITGIALQEKSGGRSGDWRRSDD
ncbi:MAG: cyclic pyranopterin monophosphate synthase MoaC [Gemmatimonadaceae bacterium]